MHIFFYVMWILTTPLRYAVFYLALKIGFLFPSCIIGFVVPCEVSPLTEVVEYSLSEVSIVFAHPHSPERYLLTLGA